MHTKLKKKIGLPQPWSPRARHPDRMNEFWVPHGHMHSGRGLQYITPYTPYTATPISTAPRSVTYTTPRNKGLWRNIFPTI